MPDAAIMRWSVEARAIYERILEHAKTCGHCRPLVRGSQEPAHVLHRLGCVTAVLLTTEWAEEYARLHTPKERKAIAELGEALGFEDRGWEIGRG